MDERPTGRDREVEAGPLPEVGRCRRAVVREGLVTGGGLLLAAASLPPALGARTAVAEAPGDIDVLRAAVRLEQVAVLAYEHALAHVRLDARFRRTVRGLRDQEREHVQALSSAMRELGAQTPPAPRTLADVDAVRPGLQRVRTQRELALFAIGLENALVAAYAEAHAKLQDARLMRTATAIMANEGQHLVVLRQAAGRDPVPSAFETGHGSA